MRNFRKLRVWHLAHELAQRIADSLPERKARRHPGLRAQVIRAADSIPANLAEGCGRSTQKDLLHFIDISLGSHTQLENHLMAARDGTIMTRTSYDRHERDLIVLGRMLRALQRTVQRNVAIEENKKRDGK